MYKRQVELKAEGSGGWLHGTSPAADYSGEVLADGQQRIVTVATAAFTGMVVLSPMMHFFMFYAFWHCVCLGSAELWGYPDRNTYGEFESTVVPVGTAILVSFFVSSAECADPSTHVRRGLLCHWW